MADAYVNIPMPFSGTDEEALANYASHYFGYEDRCCGCDSRPWGIYALHPCGANPERVDATEDEYHAARAETRRIAVLHDALMFGGAR